jgi:hypothetical protein
MNTRTLRSLATAVTAFVLLAASPAPSSAPASTPAASSGMEMNGYQIETDQTNWNMTSGDFTMRIYV